MNNFECYKDRCRDCACLSDYDGKWYCEKSDEPRLCEDVAECSVGTIDVAKMEYAILTGYGVHDIEDNENYNDKMQELYDLQRYILSHDYFIEDDGFTEYVIQYGDGTLRIDTIDDAIQSLALKDGADLVEFDDGSIGFIGYYDGFDIRTNNFKVLRHPTERDKYENDFGRLSVAGNYESAEAVSHVFNVLHGMITANCWYSTEDVRTILYDAEEQIKKGM